MMVRKRPKKESAIKPPTMGKSDETPVHKLMFLAAVGTDS